jgi:hypothetical protein
MADQVERIRSFVGYEDNLRMWGQLYVSRTGRTVVGWLLDSWSKHGEPYWLPKLHWFDKSDEKLYHVYLSMGYAGGSSMNLHGEDKDIDPKRGKFVRKMLEKWELEWLQDEGK